VDLDQRGRMQWRLDRINQEVQAREGLFLTVKICSMKIVRYLKD